MKTGTMVWIAVIIIIIVGAGAYFYTNQTTPVATEPAIHQEGDPAVLPAGDMAPTPTHPIASSTVNASTTR